MAPTSQRMSAVLGFSAVVFVLIIIILCVVPKNTPQESHHGGAKTSDLEGVIISTTTTATTTITPPTTEPTTTTTTTSKPITTTTTTSKPTTTTSKPTTTTITTTEDIITTTTVSKPPTTTTTTSEPTTTTTTTTTTSTTDTTQDTTNTITTTEDTTNTTDITEDTTNTTDITEDTTTTTEDTTNITTTTEDTTNTTDITEDTTNITDITEDTTNTTDITEDTTNITDITEDTTTITEDTITTTTDSIPTITTSEPTPTTTTASITSTTDTEDLTCKSPTCKAIAVDMLAMMDHTGRSTACKDFYQYACGGVFQKPYLLPKQPGKIAENVIKSQLDKVDDSNTTTTNNPMRKMKTYYNSCLHAIHKDNTIKSTIKNFFDTYEFQDSTTTNGSFNFDLSETLADMMTKGFSPFFNMDFEVKKSDKEAFVMRLHPTVTDSQFSGDLARKICLKKHHDHLRLMNNDDSYDVEDEYIKFMTCVRKGEGLEARLTRMKEAVVHFGLMDHFNSTLRYQLIESTSVSTKSLLKKLSDKLPDLPYLIMDLANINCLETKINTLSTNVINWETVANKVLNGKPTDDVQIYMKNIITGMEDVLSQYKNSPEELNNILLMMWSERIYTDFIKPVDARIGGQEYCLKTAITLMEDTASYLYLSSLSKEEFVTSNEQISFIAGNISWAGEIQLTDFTQDKIFKLKNMTDLKYFTDLKMFLEEVEVAAENNLGMVDLNTNFLNNSLELLKIRRILIQDTKDETPGEVMFSRPQDPFGVYNYVLNKIMIPYGALEPLTTFNKMPNYLKYAGIGYMISHLVWHGYDSSGVNFLHDKHEKIPGHKIFSDDLENLRKQYTKQKTYNNLNGPSVNYSMSNLSMNEIWADTKAIQLAWDAYLLINEIRATSSPLPTDIYNQKSYRRRRSLDPIADPSHKEYQEMPLIWLDLPPNKLYYLNWAQHHCSDSNELKMLEVMESRQPPGRVRVNFVVENDERFRKVFQCEG